ncbi:LysR family transcriptional regulator [Gracilibacillus caseinilyticus]|uniref:LysR family transcriptional regulator n=1 Tax=Gracilibacillus caseinilyticus TaxID=2932256 RepID=A0ABY4EZB1_9BACI|nr:LysR family transcriptional regulator [Gracilibacillus caseinilyticus]UOQ49747.1 LysR family transcriptional regulator [Gracilibacillus caseinilyticus]
MDIKHLTYFLEIAKTRSFTQAAENLYITQPALSRAIKSLEAELQNSLFIRTRKKILLTDAGELLHNHAVSIVEKMDKLEEDLHSLHTVHTGHIRIGLPTFIHSFFFSKLIGAFHLEYPAITFQLEENGSKIIENKVMNGQLDCGVIVLSQKNHAIDCVSFVAEPLSAVVHPSHPLADREHIHLDELKDDAFIMFNQDFELRNIILDACNQVGFQPKITSETSQLDFIEEMVASELGITLLPESTSKELSGNVQSLSISQPVVEWNLAFI